MRKENRKVLSPSGQARGSTSNQLALLFNLDSRVKPENDRGEDEGDSRIKISVALALSAMIYIGAGEAMAQCAVPPTCESLGYNLTATDCEGERTLKCPFDTSKVFCGEKNINCSVGDIYYSDGTISSSVIVGKTPVGIIAYVSGKGGFAIALEEAGSLKWGPQNDLNCLPNYTDSSVATEDMDGVQNTKCILSQSIISLSGSFPAAGYCNSYKPVSSGKGSMGWYLPAAGELHSLSYNYSTINLSLSRLSKTQLSSDYYWSSSESYYGYYAWYVRPSDGGMDYGNLGNNKGSFRRVRCVLAF